ncbi:MAG: hypothetical protein JWL69_1376 [Phycisphaerales bacterium]|jgi:hypothetical protein|nr:hypothetical protein [Phycisphaerales bacterium]MDB5353727.1 hypothetical protein [Phycisphaerales bacterium]
MQWDRDTGVPPMQSVFGVRELHDLHPERNTHGRDARVTIEAYSGLIAKRACLSPGGPLIIVLPS